MRVIIFDLDETLISHRNQLEKFIDFQYNNFYSSLKSISFEDWKKTFIKLDNNGYVTKDVVYDNLGEIFKLNINPNILYTHFLQNFHNYTSSFYGANELLHFIKNLNIKLALITNGGTLIQENKIKVLKYDNIFDEIIISETVGLEKPNSEIFNILLKKLKIKAEECIYIGDHPINDIKGANDVGLRTVWISHNRNWELRDSIPNWIVNDVKEVENIIRNELNSSNIAKELFNVI